ncbi:hypothetical protein GCM10011512_19490 [Tersicoccus solisilvae]|uniref:Uncharacterized protein n=1 Tax=Tersicoccus solisilvae TaxID=1882339 RepID=A0ABQ1PAJ3_9MICC|nr:hypothetical protein [Tersicoccus solisilvae]GGC92535.1 hypothetical protein GCM10011512_19490 [Tersicoccus solisilvae]
MLLSLVLATTPSPTPTPSNGGLKPGLSFEQVTPGTLGFLATFALAVAGLLLIRSMNKRLRRIRHRAMLEERAAAERGEGGADGGSGPGDGPDVGPDGGPADGDGWRDTGPVTGQPGRTRR